MAPRIRLSLSKPLPTIRETHEEAMEDSTSNPKRIGSTAASPDSYSSDDYVQSICHLARPTFPGLPESIRKVQDRKTLKTLDDRSWSPSQQETSKCKLSDFISNVVPLGKAAHRGHPQGLPLGCRSPRISQELCRFSGTTRRVALAEGQPGDAGLAFTGQGCKIIISGLPLISVLLCSHLPDHVNAADCASPAAVRPKTGEKPHVHVTTIQHITYINQPSCC
uniref:Uncharacterized protein n=1 Tax=Calidris pygmaea TaxID=425635 RepID=A0A8C3JCK8_9CHAR